MQSTLHSSSSFHSFLPPLPSTPPLLSPPSFLSILAQQQEHIKKLESELSHLKQSFDQIFGQEIISSPVVYLMGKDLNFHHLALRAIHLSDVDILATYLRLWVPPQIGVLLQPNQDDEDDEKNGEKYGEEDCEKNGEEDCEEDKALEHFDSVVFSKIEMLAEADSSQKVFGLSALETLDIFFQSDIQRLAPRQIRKLFRNAYRTKNVGEPWCSLLKYSSPVKNVPEKKICRNYAEFGICKYGDKCRYFHPK